MYIHDKYRLVGRIELDSVVDVVLHVFKEVEE